MTWKPYPARQRKDVGGSLKVRSSCYSYSLARIHDPLRKDGYRDHLKGWPSNGSDQFRKIYDFLVNTS